MSTRIEHHNDLSWIEVARWPDGWRVVRVVQSTVEVIYDLISTFSNGDNEEMWGWSDEDLHDAITENLAFFLVLDTDTPVAMIGIYDSDGPHRLESAFVQSIGHYYVKDHPGVLPKRIRGFLLGALHRNSEQEDDIVYAALGYPVLLEKKHRDELIRIDATQQEADTGDGPGRQPPSIIYAIEQWLFSIGAAFQGRNLDGFWRLTISGPTSIDKDEIFVVAGKKPIPGFKPRSPYTYIGMDETADSEPVTSFQHDAPTLQDAILSSGRYLMRSDWDHWAAANVDEPESTFDFELYLLMNEAPPPLWPLVDFIDFARSME